jgi:transcription-repair coupling factor (superfamily II helicase)
MFSKISGSELSLAIREWSQRADHLVCVIVPNILSVQKIQEELQFFSTENDLPILHLPDWETLPYDHFSPHQDIISERLATLSRLKTLKSGILVTALPTVLHRLPPYSFIAAHSFNLSVKDTLDLDTFRGRLQQAGYVCVNKVMEHGEYAIRGSIIDLYPMGSTHPFRLDLFDHDIDSIRLFDVDSQRSLEKVNRIELLPAREFPLDEKGIAHFRKAWRSRFEGNPTNVAIYNAVSDGVMPAGIEYYLPLFFDENATLWDYLPQNTEFFLIDEKESIPFAGEHFFEEVKLRYEQRKHDISKPILSPDELFLSMEHFKSLLDNETTHSISWKDPIENFPLDIKAQKNAEFPFEKLGRYIETTDARVLICAQTAGRRELLLEQLSMNGIRLKSYSSWLEFMLDDAHAGIIQGPLECGFVSSSITLITESELWGETLVRQRRSTRRNLDMNNIIRDLSELQIGSAVVHLEHGVGRYQGLKNIEHDNQINEFLILEYANNDKIYVPVTSLENISRYTGLDPEHAPLHKLGSDQWQKEKKKAQEKIHDVAVELLEIYAKREAQTGFVYACPDKDYQAFSTAFPFEETLDQKQAIKNVLDDMQSTKPMDRLICGDVGFGKTEVAMRACFLAVQNHKQVCILVPTTLLAGQHYESFCNRFADFGVNIELLSRFRTVAASEKVIEGLKTGRVDIVIGTHKLFSKKIEFNRLGLLIIDEEHRFGVRQKEFMKALRHEVDILSLTATPIPRTLNMSLSGLRDISVIATPPLRRLAIKTFTLERNNATIREAILREIMRGGQVFYLHNKVSSIESTSEELKKLVPEASIQTAHGQMPERQLEKIMSDFYHRRFQVLVCSTIIETGIDVPTANTIIIERADMFGLAQLHQLRGRVGRSHHQAYAYLLTPHPDAMTPDAVKRLDAIMSIEDLGAGFTLATHDLEIRGAGELLGDEQSGNMHAIGFSLYMELLETAVEALKSGKVPELDKPTHHGAEINLNMSLIIPENYMPDVHMRLVLYKRIAHAENTKQLDDLHVEMVDRFGLLPVSVKNLFRTMELKFTAQELGIKKITANPEFAKIEFDEQPNIKPETIIKLIQVQPKTYKLDGPNRLKCAISVDLERIDAVNQFLRVLSS